MESHIHYTTLDQEEWLISAWRKHSGDVPRDRVGRFEPVTVAKRQCGSGAPDVDRGSARWHELGY
jgi:hypothetical protein